MSSKVLHGRQTLLVALSGLMVLAFAWGAATAAAAAHGHNAVFGQAQARTPSDVVRGFYRALREKRFREAFAMSIYKPAVEKLNAEEYEELRPDFERIASNVPEKVEIGGEQISGDTATVFVRIFDGEAAGTSEPVTLLRAGDAWVVGDHENKATVEKDGKDFFIKTRINTHHSEVQTMLGRIAAAQLVYGAQRGGQVGDLEALVRAGLVPQDVLGVESTGYRFSVVSGKDGKSFAATAVPDRYGRTGRLSFFMDASGIRSKDNGGKPFKP